MHYVAMMLVAAAISLYGTGSSEEFRRSYEAVASGEIGEAFSYATAGLRRALREADPDRHLRP